MILIFSSIALNSVAIYIYIYIYIYSISISISISLDEVNLFLSSEQHPAILNDQFTILQKLGTSVNLDYLN